MKKNQLMPFRRSLCIALVFCVFSFLSSTHAQNQVKQGKRAFSFNQKKMQGMLANLKPKADFEQMFFLLNDQGVIYYQNKLKNLKAGEDEIGIRYLLAEQLLLDGKSEASVKELETILPLSKGQDENSFGTSNYTKIRRLLAVAYFRMGEQANCILDHNAESCIFPIRGKGIYKFREPTKHAIQVFKEILADNPRDYESMWVMNVAYMTLGIYPDSVPKPYYIPYNTFDENKGAPMFKDIAPQLGFTSTGLAGSVIMDDFDNDDDLDLFITSESYDAPVKYYENAGNLGFIDRTEQAGLLKEIGGRICQQADYNNDGLLDIFVIRGGWQKQENNYPPNTLLKNNGDGTFTDVTIESGLLTFMATSSVSWGDYDNDGWLDLFLSVETQNPGSPHPCRLFRNNHDGTFVDVSVEAGIRLVGFMKGSMWADFNNDGYQDLYISNYRGRNVLLMNNKGADGKFFFTDVSRIAGVQQPMSGIGCLVFDYNNDGWLDIFAPASTLGPNGDAVALDYLYRKPNEESLPRFYRNEHDGKFSDVTKEVGLNRAIYAMGMNFGDIDHDGFLDMYIGTGFLDFRSIYPNLMLRNNDGNGFLDVSNASGTSNLQKGHGIAFGDIDNDGDQDVFEVLGGGYTGDLYQNSLLENPGNANHWVYLSLKGVKSNTSAIGAKIKVTVETENGSTRDIYNTLNSGGPFGASPLRREIGLGAAKSIKNIEIYWPASGMKQNFKDVTMDGYYKLTEGIDTLEVQVLKKYQFAKAAVKNHVKPH